VDLNLDTLKREIMEYLESGGFAVFHSSPGGLEGMPMVLWDSARYPDYQMFLDVARKADVRMVLFASREFAASEIDELLEQLEECELTREERRDYEIRLRDLRIYEGVTCTLELAFDLDSRLYVYEVQPDWYDDFLNLDEEISARLAGDEEFEDGDSLGGYFSRN
jgi:hypothetical protein